MGSVTVLGDDLFLRMAVPEQPSTTSDRPDTSRKPDKSDKAGTSDTIRELARAASASK